MCILTAFTASGFFLGHQRNIFICFAQVLNENGVISFGLIAPVLKVMLKKKTALKHNNYSIRRNTEMTETIMLLLLSHLQYIDHDLLWSHKFYKIDLSIEFPKTFLQCHQTRPSGKSFWNFDELYKIR